mgnify:CR=1 FL=1
MNRRNAAGCRGRTDIHAGQDEKAAKPLIRMACRAVSVAHGPFGLAWAALTTESASLANRMKTPPRLQSLVEEGLIDTVVRQLMSGKEAMVYVVRRGDQTLCAKIYKEATNRSFRQAVDYTENRKTKNTRQARAMAKGTRFGRRRPRKLHGRAPRLMRSIAWPQRGCAYLSPTLFWMACC